MVDGSLAMIAAAAVASGHAAHAAAGELYQTSLMSALVEGIYEGQTRYGDLHAHGDFGLGTFNDLDGEMVGFDGVFYPLRSDGSARPVTDDQLPARQRRAAPRCPSDCPALGVDIATGPASSALFQARAGVGTTR